MSVVTTRQGKLRGVPAKLPNGDTYVSFKGIPYAKPPLGELRFRAPLPPDSWEGIRDATEHGAICPQYDGITGQMMEGDENCLYLNVYSKSISSSELAPVMFWVHGGGYMSGSGNADIYGPQYLLQHNVVIVTINYRLEALGFLCLDNEKVPGNAGLKDQAAALKWVNENIAQFGGDPNNVTLFGESAGAASVIFHTVSPMSRGLFHKVIAQSGVPTCDWAFTTNGKERAFRLGRALGMDTNDPDELLEFLQSVPATKLSKATFKTMSSDEKIRGVPIHFCPIAEKQFPCTKPFITENILLSLKKDNIAHVPILMGYNTAEGMLVARDTLKKKDFVNKNFHCKVPREVYEKIPKNKSEELGDRVKKFYFQGEDISDDNENQVCKMESDILFIFNCHRFADAYSKLNRNAVYMYMFDCVSDINITKTMTGIPNVEGASHADDLFYLFCNTMTAEMVDNDVRIKEMVSRMTKMWTNFAKTGNPTPDGTLGVTWLPYDETNKALLYIGDELQIRRPNQRVLDFWNKIYVEAGCITPKSSL